MVLSIPGDLQESASKGAPAIAVARVVWRRDRGLPVSFSASSCQFLNPRPASRRCLYSGLGIDEVDQRGPRAPCCRRPAAALQTFKWPPRSLTDALSSRGLRRTTSCLLLPAQAALTTAGFAEPRRPCCQRRKAVVCPDFTENWQLSKRGIRFTTASEVSVLCSYGGPRSCPWASLLERTGLSLGVLLHSCCFSIGMCVSGKK